MGIPRVTGLIGLLIFFAAPATHAQILTASFYQRYEPLAGDLAWGNLTWDGTQGSLSWAPNPATKDDRPATHGDEFVSDPLEAPLYLNVSKHIQLELMLKDPPNYANACASSSADPDFQVTITVDGKRLASGIPGQQHYWYYLTPSHAAPPDPTGYSICRFRMPAELDVLPAGSVLKVRMEWFSTQYAWSYGLASEHRSTLYLPFFTYEEAVFRLPELKAAEDEKFAESQGGGASMGALLVLSTVSVLGRGGRAPRLALLLLCAAVLAGCVGSKKPEAVESSEQTLKGRIDNVIIAEPGVVGGLGTIVGQVHDDLHLPVGDVHVSVLGQAAFTSTDGKGRFVLRDLAAGIHKLRFDRKEFRSFEADVEVRAAAVSRLDVTLYPVDLKARDYRPHTHDYWPANVGRKPVLDTVLPEECTVTGGCVHDPNFFLVPKEGDTNTILPGTRSVELKLHWDPAKAPYKRLGIAVATNQDKFYLAWQNYTVLAPRAPDEPFRLATSWESTDAGHQPYSGWTFKVFAPRGQAEQYTSAYGLEVSLQASTPVTLAASIVKGALPLEAPHKDHWAGKSRIDVSKTNFIRNVWYAQPPPPHPGLWSEANYKGVFLSPEKVVPPGTKTLEIALTATRDHSATYRWDLYYKPASVAPGAANPVSGAGYAKAQRDAGSTGTAMKWVLSLKETESDFEYAKKSNWIFNFRPDNTYAGWADTGVDFFGPGMRTNFGLLATAAKG